MAAIRVRLVRREPVADGTVAFRFKPVDGNFSFLPGQAIDLRWDGAPSPDPRGHVRPFTIANSPGTGQIMIATRIRESPFKQDLLDASFGEEMEADGPWGDFVLPKDAKDVVMIAGGIGVTPFRSILEDAVARSLPHDLSLIHAARTPEETPFLEEFRRWTTGHPRFTYLPTMTRPQDSGQPWLGMRRRVDAPFLDETLDDRRAAALYMVSGPPAFVKDVAAALVTVGVPAGRVMTDEFEGY
jgi:ferredoxin-NADP reductase